MRVIKLYLYILFAFTLAFGVSSCRTQKNAIQTELTHQQKVEKAIKQLNTAMDNESLSNEAKLALIDEIRALELNNENLNTLLDRNEKYLKEQILIDADAERRAKERDRLEKEKNEKQGQAKVDLISYFSKIAQAESVEMANSLILEAIGLFESKHTPVLIIIKKNGSLKEYDRPNSILRYLEHIKDFKTYNTKIENIIFNEDNGKIAELELLK